MEMGFHGSPRCRRMAERGQDPNLVKSRHRMAGGLLPGTDLIEGYEF
jgi:hypothetical protein